MIKLQNIKFKHKMALLPAIFILILIVFMVMFNITTTENQKLTTYIENDYVSYIELSHSFNENMKELQRGFQDAVAATDKDKLNATVLIKQKLDSTLQIAQKSVVINKDSVALLTHKFNNYYALAFNTSEKMIAGDFSEATSAQIQQMIVNYNSVTGTIKNINIASKILSGQEISEAQKKVHVTTMVLIILALLGLSMVIFLSVVITRNIISDIGGEPSEVYVIAIEIANGNLMVQFDTNRKKQGIYGAMQDMTEKLKSVVASVIQGADNIATAGQQISTTTQEMSQNASEQASSVEEISSSIEEMTSTVQQNTDSANQADQMASLASRNIAQSNEAVKNSTTSMKEIAGKISIIGEIAFQTNILALNAAVEAARAGEHGRGFAVVAAEVRKLAERSRTAADEINILSKNGVETVETAGKQFEEIVPEINRTSKLVQEIAAASNEQSSGIGQISASIQTLNQVTQQNAAASEEMATNAEELASQAEELKEMISYFNVGNITSSGQSQQKKNKTQFLHASEIKGNTKIPPYLLKGNGNELAYNRNTKSVLLDMKKLKEYSDDDFEKF
jgi:methyl-accepting chemotaxis protein